MKVKEIIIGVLALLLCAGQLSFAQRRAPGRSNIWKHFSRPKEIDIASGLWDIAQQEPTLAAVIAFALAGHQQMEDKFWRSFTDRTKDYPRLSEALAKSPTFRGKYVLGLVDAQHMSKPVFASVEEFLLTPWEKLKGEPYKNGYRFHLPRVNAVAETDRERKIILVRQESILSEGQAYYSHLVKPKKLDPKKKTNAKKKQARR